MVVLEGLGANSHHSDGAPHAEAAKSERSLGGGADPSLPRKGGRPTAAEHQWLTWRRHVLSQLVLVTALYGVAHLLFMLHWNRAGAFALSNELQLALLLFVLGLLLLARLMRTLDERAAGYHPARVQQAGSFLVITIGLCFSPCIWLILCQS